METPILPYLVCLPKQIFNFIQKKKFVERPEMGRKRKFWKVKEEFLGGSKIYLQKADMFTRFCWSFHLCSSVKFDFAEYRKQ
jgi:hypothetical protein